VDHSSCDLLGECVHTLRLRHCVLVLATLVDLQ
jgi:hypothetical protein